MTGESKYIIFAFLILAFIFIGIYLVSEFISNAKDATRGVIESASFQYRDTSKPRYDGKIIFQNQCAACHIIGHYATGSDLTGFTERGPWRNKKKILEYLRDPLQVSEK